MPSKTTLALASAAALAAASLAVAGEPQTTTRTETKTRVVVMNADHASLPADGHQIMVTSRAIDGADPTMQVKVLGEGLEGETIDVGSLEPGETRTFTTKDGKDVVVTRGETGVTLSVDGKEIELPSLTNLSVMHAGPGAAVASAWTAGDGQVVTDDQNVVVVGAPHVMIGGPGALAGNFDQLDSLKDLDPEVREKVVAALHEILSGKGGMAYSFATTIEGPEGAIAVPAVPGTPGAPHVIVHRVVKDDAKAEPGSKME